MKFSQEIYTRQTSWLRGLLLETKQRLSSTLFYTAQEMQRSEVSSEELLKMVSDLRKSSSAIRLLLEGYENELGWLQEEVMFLDWIGEGSMYGQNTRH